MDLEFKKFVGSRYISPSLYMMLALITTSGTNFAQTKSRLNNLPQELLAGPVQSQTNEKPGKRIWRPKNSTAKAFWQYYRYPCYYDYAFYGFPAGFNPRHYL